MCRGKGEACPIVYKVAPMFKPSGDLACYKLHNFIKKFGGARLDALPAC
jgi:hypothetical protein